MNTRKHEGTEAVNQSNTRSALTICEIAIDKSDKVRVALALDCFVREIISWGAIQQKPTTPVIFET